MTTCHSSASVGTRLEYDNDGRIKNKTVCAREVRGWGWMARYRLWPLICVYSFSPVDWHNSFFAKFIPHSPSQAQGVHKKYQEGKTMT